ncbi:hypothetical protein ACET3Z_027638 [Daucus carota]
MRDTRGKKVWGAEGPLNHMTEKQALMAGIRAAIVHAKEKKWELTLIETSNRKIFELISNQDQFIIPEELLEVFRLFNSVHANHPASNLDPDTVQNSRKISFIPDHMNSAAIYMADHALHNFSDFVELPGASTLGNLQYLLNRDIGLVIADPGVVLVQNIGLGEVVNEAHPPRPLKHKRGEFCAECGQVVPRQPSGLSGCSIVGTSAFQLLQANKGKASGYEAFAFYEGGAFSQHAINILNSGALVQYSPFFEEHELNLEAHVKNGFFVKDVLHHACLGTLGLVEFMLQDSYVQVTAEEMVGMDRMSTNQMIDSLGFDDAVVPVAVGDTMERQEADGLVTRKSTE